MNLFLSVVLAVPVACLAVLTFLALLGVLTLAGALRGLGATGANARKVGVVDGGKLCAANRWIIGGHHPPPTDRPRMAEVGRIKIGHCGKLTITARAFHRARNLVRPRPRVGLVPSP
jgi:hypothetical protein